MNFNQDLLVSALAMFPKYLITSSECHYISTIGDINKSNLKYRSFDIYTQHIDKIVTILFLHMNFQFKSLIDLFGCDYLGKHYRFQIIYQIISYNYYTRLFLKAWVSSNNIIQSITSIYPSANWYERECWDMYGVSFIKHPDLRRILTDYGFSGHPLRKDFPLSGYAELHYEYRYQRVSYESIRTIQEFRTFNIVTPWEYHYTYKINK